MQKIRLKVNDKANNKLLSSDGKGLKKECNLLKENPDLEKTKKYLQDQLMEIESGNAIFYTIEEVELQMENILNIKR